jgi:hypothetical protein
MLSLVTRCVGIGALAVVTGCYTYVPLEPSAPPPRDETVALEITDRGRLELGDRLGPGVLRVEGRITDATPDVLMVNVFRVAQINGQRSQWSGESVRLDRAFVGRVQERQLSRTRTAIAVAAVAVGVGAFIATRGLSGLFNGGDDPGDPVDPPDIRIMRPQIHRFSYPIPLRVR